MRLPGLWTARICGHGTSFLKFGSERGREAAGLAYVQVGLRL